MMIGRYLKTPLKIIKNGWLLDTGDPQIIIMKYSNYIIETEAAIFRYYRQKNLAMTILLREL